MEHTGRDTTTSGMSFKCKTHRNNDVEERTSPKSVGMTTTDKSNFISKEYTISRLNFFEINICDLKKRLQKK